MVALNALLSGGLYSTSACFLAIIIIINTIHKHQTLHLIESMALVFSNLWQLCIQPVCDVRRFALGQCASQKF